MKYKAIPALLVSVESGHKFGPPLECETTPLNELAGEDTTKDVVVVTVQDFLRVASIEVGEPTKKDMIPLAFHVADARKLCIDLLLHLASMGDKVARHLCEQLKHYRDES